MKVVPVIVAEQDCDDHRLSLPGYIRYSREGFDATRDLMGIKKAPLNLDWSRPISNLGLSEAGSTNRLNCQ